jgi:hypothetical protein
MRHALRWLAAAAVFALGGGSARAQTAESSLSAFLVARVSWPTSAGDRIVAVRIGTKDLVAPLLQELGISGRIVALATRRALADRTFASPSDFLVVDGTRYDVTGRIRPPATGLPGSFFATARTSALRRTDSAEWYFLDQVSEALQIGELETHGSELTVVGTAHRSARLLTQQGIDLGFLFASVRTSVVGGLTDSYAFRGSFQGATGLVRGWLLRGPEKLVVSP